MYQADPLLVPVQRRPVGQAGGRRGRGAGDPGRDEDPGRALGTGEQVEQDGGSPAAERQPDQRRVGGLAERDAVQGVRPRAARQRAHHASERPCCQAAVLKARGDSEALVLRAEADATAQAARARGQAEAISTVFKAIHEGNPDQRLLAYQYMQMLPQIAQGDANKVWIVPSEISKALEGIGGFFSAADTRFAGPPVRWRRTGPGRHGLGLSSTRPSVVTRVWKDG